ncbi:MAG TPA: PAS domain S-box protein, partial [Nitrospira sp.]|nr:PAS domain S-box protein [Nitrospira sp.]
MSTGPAHILLVEDNAGDARLLRELLTETGAGRLTLTHVDRLDAAIRCLTQAAFDIILLDLSLPDSQGAETLVRMHAAAQGIPIVLVTGLEDEELGIQLIQAGAQDYLVKRQTTAPLLARALKYAVERKRLEEELRQKTRFLQSVLDNMAEGVVMADERGTFQVWNQAAERIIGSGPADIGIGEWSKHYALFLPDRVTPFPTDDLPLARAIRGESVTDVLIFFHRPHWPGEAWLSVTARPLLDDTGHLSGGVAVFRDITAAKRTDEALRDSQERYRLLVTKANDIIYRTDASGRFTFVNPVAMRIMKYTEPELLGRRFIELIHPDHQPAAERFYGRQFVRKQPSTYYEFLALAKDGSEVWIGQNVQVLLEEGQVVGFQAVARDITDRKRAEEARLESEERLRSIVQSTGDAIILMDTRGQVAFWNSGAEKIFGYTAEQMLGQPVTRIIPQRFREAHQRGVERVAAAGRLTLQADMFELIGLRKDGTEFPLEFSLAAWTAKSTLFITGIIRDISERRQAETALRDSEERFRAIMNNSPALIFIKDLAGRYLQANRQFEIISHLSHEDLVGKTDEEVFPPEQAAVFRDNDRKVLETGEPMRFEESALHDDGLHTSIVVKFPLRNAQ